MKRHFCSKKCTGLANRKRLILQCAICGKDIERKEFELNSNKNLYCSRKCADIALVKKIIISCDNCGNEFANTPSNINKASRHFCCLDCCNEFKRKNPDQMVSNYKGSAKLQCAFCGIPYTKKIHNIKKGKQYCSKECKNKAKIKAMIITCDYCSNEFPRTNKHYNRTAKHYCSKTCFIEGNRGDNHYNWQGGISDIGYEREFNKKLKKLIRLRDGYTCQECGKTEEELDKTLSVHHIDYDKKNNDPANLMSLCKKCHTTTNYNREEWEKHYKIKKQNIQEVD